MDYHQLTRSVNYHGSTLLKYLMFEDHNVGDIMIPAERENGRNRSEIRDRVFTDTVQRFIARKADLLFKDEKPPDDVDHVYKTYGLGEDLYSILPPMESFMGIPPEDARLHFYQSVEKKDILIGSVTAINDNGIIINLLCMDGVKARDIEHLEITAFCHCKELPRHYNYPNPLDAFQINDKIRAVVVNVNRENKKILISMLDKYLSTEDYPFPKLGLVSTEELPVHYRRKLYYCDSTYDKLLHTVIGFNNSGCIPYLLQLLKHPTDSGSLTRGLSKFSLPDSEFAEALTNAQSRKMANNSVAEGIALFKRNQELEAMQMFNKALQIHANNVEALVARGALYANNENYKRAIEDFEGAYAANPHHQNACKYLSQTLVAHGKILEEQNKSTEAETYYKRALQVDPLNCDASRYMRKTLVKNKTANNSAHDVQNAEASLSRHRNSASLDNMEGAFSQNKSDKTGQSFKRVKYLPYRKDHKYHDGSNSDASSSHSSRIHHSVDSHRSQHSRLSETRDESYCESQDYPDNTHNRWERQRSSGKNYKMNLEVHKSVKRKRTNSNSSDYSGWDEKLSPDNSPHNYDCVSSSYRKPSSNDHPNRNKVRSQSQELKEVYVKQERSHRLPPNEESHSKSKKSLHEATYADNYQSTYDSSRHGKHYRVKSQSPSNDRKMTNKYLASDCETEFNKKRQWKNHDSKPAFEVSPSFASKNHDSTVHDKKENKKRSWDGKEKCESPPRKHARKHSLTNRDDCSKDKFKLPDVVESTRTHKRSVFIETGKKHSQSLSKRSSSDKKQSHLDSKKPLHSKGKHNSHRSSSIESSSSSSSSSTSSSSSSTSTSSSSSPSSDSSSSSSSCPSSNRTQDKLKRSLKNHHSAFNLKPKYIGTSCDESKSDQSKKCSLDIVEKAENVKEEEETCEKILTKSEDKVCKNYMPSHCSTLAKSFEYRNNDFTHTDIDSNCRSTKPTKYIPKSVKEESSSKDCQSPIRKSPLDLGNSINNSVEKCLEADRKFMDRKNLFESCDSNTVGKTLESTKVENVIKHTEIDKRFVKCSEVNRNVNEKIKDVPLSIEDNKKFKDSVSKQTKLENCSLTTLSQHSDKINGIQSIKKVKDASQNIGKYLETTLLKSDRFSQQLGENSSDSLVNSKDKDKKQCSLATAVSYPPQQQSVLQPHSSLSDSEEKKDSKLCRHDQVKRQDESEHPNSRTFEKDQQRFGREKDDGKQGVKHGHKSLEGSSDAMKGTIQSTETLDELESFLSELKEKKKQQMMAEGGKAAKWKKTSTK